MAILSCGPMAALRQARGVGAAILNLHERMENKLFLDRTRKDSNFKRPHIYATLFQIEKCCYEIAVRNVEIEAFTRCHHRKFSLCTPLLEPVGEAIDQAVPERLDRHD